MISDQGYPHAVLAWLHAGDSPLLSRRAVQLWRAINEELSPLIGISGFTALYSRCLDLSGARFPWLERAPARSSPTRLFDTLGEQLAARTAPEALDASRALFATFHELLQLLIGPSLTVVVLDAAWRDRLSQQSPRLLRNAASP